MVGLTDVDMPTVVKALGGIGISLYAGLCVLRWWRSRKWGYYKIPSGKSLKGKVFVVTGANCGLGFETARTLVKHEATVILGCRNVPAGEVALNRIIGEIGTPVGQVQVFQLDLGCFASIRTFVYHLRTQYDFVDTLICNAGVWVPMDQRQKTSDGFELHFGVNHLGHFYLAKLLLEGDNMISDRIILVSSSLMARDLDVNRKLAFEGREPQTTGDGKDKKKTSKWVPTGYEDTKLMNALLSTELDRRLKSRKDEPSIGVYSCCPGFCSSNLGRHNKISSWKRSLLTPIFFVLQRSPERGSHNILYLALEDKQRLVSGGFYKECKLDSEVMKRLQDLATQGKQLYDLSEELIAEQNRGKNVGPHLPQY